MNLNNNNVLCYPIHFGFAVGLFSTIPFIYIELQDTAINQLTYTAIIWNESQVRFETRTS